MTITLHIDDNTPQRVLRAMTTMLHQLQHMAPDDEERRWSPLVERTDIASPEVKVAVKAQADPDLGVVPPPPRMPPLAEPIRQQMHGLDSHGLPWDERIHSDKRGVNADGTWRLRRNINTTAPGLVERVRAEQRAALAAPLIQAEQRVIIAQGGEIVVSEVSDPSSFTPVHELVAIPPVPLPPTPPVPSAPAPDGPPSPPSPAVPPPPPMPVTTEDEVTSPERTFSHVLMRITSDQASGTIRTEQVDAALQAVGLTTIRDLTTRLDLVIPFEMALYGS